MTEWHASDYARQSSLQMAMAEENLGLLRLRGNERILDVGCGDGKITAEIAARVPLGSVLGTDPSHEMIAFAGEHFGPASHPNLRFEVADARTMAYPSEFDLVVSFNALHWVPEQDLALRCIRSALKTEGQALLRLVPQGARESLEDVIEEIRNRPDWQKHFVTFRKPFLHLTPEAYADLAKTCGLSVISQSIGDKAWDFRTRDAFMAFARATFVEWTKCLPASLEIPFITAVLDRYQEVAAETPKEAHTFKFYQMVAWLERVDQG